MSFLSLVETNIAVFSSNNYNQMEAFLQKLENICAQYFEIPSCKVYIKQLSPTRTSFGHIPPACFKCSYHTKSKEQLTTLPEIILNKDIIQSYPYIKIIKLLMHEWMHYLTYYHLHISPCSNIPNKYLQFIDKADDVKKLHIETLTNKNLAKSLQKLSPSEFVADLFARDILSFIAMQTSITSLRKDASDKIQREEDMQIKHLNNINKICKSNYSNSNKIEFEKIVTSRRMKNVKTT